MLEDWCWNNREVIVKWLCLKSLRTSGGSLLAFLAVHWDFWYKVRISKWLLRSHETMLKTRNAHVLKWRKSTEINFWLSRNFWHFDFSQCRLWHFKMSMWVFSTLFKTKIEIQKLPFTFINEKVVFYNSRRN